MAAPEKTGSHVCFGGENTFYKHQSSAIGGSMNFTVYLPPQAKDAGHAGRKLPTLMYLAGLTCDNHPPSSSRAAPSASPPSTASS